MASTVGLVRIEATVLRTVGPQGSLFELLLPPGMRVLRGELADVDALFDDRRFFGPFRRFFDPTEGRPSIPIDTYLRLMFLKYRYDVGYERLCRLVNDSITWRRFCRIGLEASVPDESTIRKITRRCGPELIDALNIELLAAAHERGDVDLAKVRADTTVVEADIKYPTDSGLLTSATARIASGLRRLAGVGVKVAHTDRTLQARALQHSIGVWLRRRSDEAKAEVLVITGQLADLAAASMTEAMKALLHRPRRRRVRRLLDDLAVLIDRTNQVIAQARCRVHGDQPDGATRLVSLHEPDARPIRKGRLGKPVEFGFKAQAVDNTDGIIIDHSVHIGNPSDTDLLRPAIERITTMFAQAPALVTADRGYWDSTIETDLTLAGVDCVVIPRTGKPSKTRAAIEHATDFVIAVKWRTGCEGRISHLKRDWAWRRARLRCHDGARIWCGHGVFAHNLVKLIELQR
jgi:transposase, IS5 family